MDTEDGVEVVWNEVRYSSRKAVAASKEVLVKILKRLTEMQHPNIVNFMSFWHDKVSNQDRLVFITEHMTSGSLLHFLLKAKRPAAGKTSVSDKVCGYSLYTPCSRCSLVFSCYSGTLSMYSLVKLLCSSFFT
jgi:hypothetical protein